MFELMRWNGGIYLRSKIIKIYEKRLLVPRAGYSVYPKRVTPGRRYPIIQNNTTTDALGIKTY